MPRFRIRLADTIQESTQTHQTMLRGPLYQTGYNPQFSGHETFPLRYGWLKKVFDRVSAAEGEPGNKSSCWADDAIACFGVGKNMVAAMRHWAKIIGIIEEAGSNTVATALLGKKIFGENGLDPYMENPITLWLFHRRLASKPVKTTWFWAFNHYSSITFERDHLIRGLRRLAKQQNWAKTAEITLRKDVACFIHTYVARQPANVDHDDALGSPLIELGLIKTVGKNNGFRFARGPKSTLTHGMFVYALIDFWMHYSPHTTTLSFEAVNQYPGSPGRVFMFDENDTAEHLARIDNITDGKLRWSETAGLKQVVRTAKLSDDIKLNYLLADYAKRRRKKEVA